MTVAGAAPLGLTVTDLKQSAYCPRLPYYRYVLPVKQVATFRMGQGKDVQGAVQALERRRGFRQYAVEEGERLFGLRLRSERLGLAGQVDLLVKTREAAHPVDFKDTAGPARGNHRVQLAGYALLIEEAFGLPVPWGYVYLVPRKEVVPVPLGPAERDDVLRRMEEIRRMAASEAMPEPTRFRARCAGCEYRNYCADIW